MLIYHLLVIYNLFYYFLIQYKYNINCKGFILKWIYQNRNIFLFFTVLIGIFIMYILLQFVTTGKIHFFISREDFIKDIASKDIKYYLPTITFISSLPTLYLMWLFRTYDVRQQIQKAEENINLSKFQKAVEMIYTPDTKDSDSKVLNSYLQYRIVGLNILLQFRKKNLFFEEMKEIFIGMNLKEANLSTKELSNINFSNANFQGAYLPDANLKGANLPNANLQGAFLLNANLQGANLLNANLQGAFLYDADLQGANLQWANLQGANLQGAYFQKGNSSGILHLTKESLDDARENNSKLKISELKETTLVGAKLQDYEITEEDMKLFDFN